MVKATKEQLIIALVMITFAWVFTIGMTTVIGNILVSKYIDNSKTIDSLHKENSMLKIEVQGLTRLMKIKDDQSICHYTHVEVKHDFRVINKR